MKTMKQKHYSEEFKEQALAKVFGRSSDQSVDSIADGLEDEQGNIEELDETIIAGAKVTASEREAVW